VLGVLHVERALVQLRHRVVRLQQRHLFVHFPDDEPGQRHAGDTTHQFDGATVVHVTVPDVELFTLALVVVQQVDGERAPLRRARVKVALLHVQVPSAHRLRPEPVEQRHFRAAGDAQIRVLQRLLLLRRFRYHLDALAVERADVVADVIEHSHHQHEVLPFVRVRDEQRFRGAILFAVVEVQRLQLLVGAPDTDERAHLRIRLGHAFAQQLLLPESPSVAEQIDARWRTKEPLFVAVRLLRHFGVQNHQH